MKRRAKRIYSKCKNPIIFAEHLCNCSCAMCGNPRKYGKGKEKLTRQEILALDDFSI